MIVETSLSGVGVPTPKEVGTTGALPRAGAWAQSASWRTGAPTWERSYLSIGGSYQCRLDLDLLAGLGQAVDIPLVLHGGSGIPDEEIPAIVACGVHKINVGSVLKQAFLDGICRAIETGALTAGPHAAMGCQQPGDLMWEGEEAIKAVIRQKMGVYGSAGRGTMTNHG